MRWHSSAEKYDSFARQQSIEQEYYWWRYGPGGMKMRVERRGESMVGSRAESLHKIDDRVVAYFSCFERCWYSDWQLYTIVDNASVEKMRISWPSRYCEQVRLFRYLERSSSSINILLLGSERFESSELTEALRSGAGVEARDLTTAGGTGI